MGIKEYYEEYQKVQFNDYNKWCLENIKRSSDCRIWLNKNIRTASYEDIIKAMATCIYDLTGDSVFRDQVYEGINRRFNNEDIN